MTEMLAYSIDETRVLMHNPCRLDLWREIKMIRGAGIMGSHRAPSLRRFLLTSCAALVGAGIMLLASPVGGPGSARAQFGFGGFHFSIGPGHWRRGRHSSRSARRHRRHRNDRNDDDTPDPDAGGGSSSTSASTPAPDNTGRATVRPASSTSSEPRPSSGRPAPRGPDLEPSK
jgi:hypothetical protein